MRSRGLLCPPITKNGYSEKPWQVRLGQPERLVDFALAVAVGQADIAQKMIVKPRQGLPVPAPFSPRR